MRRLTVFDTTLRDGEQSPGCSMDVPTKLLVAEQLALLGVDVIEAGFAIASPGDREAIALISEKIRGPIICSLARTRREDILAAAGALEKAVSARIHTFVATSDVHMQNKLRKSPAEILDMVAENVSLARKYVSSVEFSPEDAVRTGIDFLKQVVRVAVEAGATTINLPDTVGYSVGDEYPLMICEIKTLLAKLDSPAVISVHCHNDLGLAVANTLAGIRAGAGQVECCVLGIGERAGNAHLSAVLMALKTRQDYYDIDFGVDSRKLCPTARLVSSMIGKPIPDNLPIDGGNAFAHGAGIHQHGMLHDKRTYQIMMPEDVGWEGDSSPLVKHSGKAALGSKLSALGYKLEPENLLEIYEKFLALADHKTYVYAEDLQLLMQEMLLDKARSDKLLKYERVDYHRVKDSLSATVTLSQCGEIFEASGAGDGAIASVGDALLKAVSRRGLSIGKIQMKVFNTSKSAGGIEAVGLVNIKLESERGVGYGRGSDVDTIVAFAKAMVSAINHLAEVPVKECNGNGA